MGYIGRIRWMQPTAGLMDCFISRGRHSTGSCQPRALRGNGFAVKRRNLHPLKIAKNPFRQAFTSLRMTRLREVFCVKYQYWAPQLYRRNMTNALGRHDSHSKRRRPDRAWRYFDPHWYSLELLGSLFYYGEGHHYHRPRRILEPRLK